MWKIVEVRLQKCLSFSKLFSRPQDNTVISSDNTLWKSHDQKRFFSENTIIQFREEGNSILLSLPLCEAREYDTVSDKAYLLQLIATFMLSKWYHHTDSGFACAQLASVSALPGLRHLIILIAFYVVCGTFPPLKLITCIWPWQLVERKVF